jgi:hypothetical protein
MSKPPLDFNANGEVLKTAITDVKTDYSLVYFPTDSKSVGRLDTGKCMAVSEYDNVPSVAMKQLDGNLHTPESCKLNVGMIQSAEKWQNYMNDKKTSKVITERGLKYTVVQGYFADNPDFFKSAKVLNTGTAKKFDNIRDSTNGYIATPHSTSQHTYSVEWYGTFTTPMTGPYHFVVSSDDASYMWIGKYAMGNTSTKNALAKNGNLHGFKHSIGYIYLQAGISYPIRFQFGENWGGHDFSIALYGLDENRRWIRYNFPDMVTPEVNVKDTKQYYALVEQDADSSAKGLFNCYISDTTNSNVPTTQRNFKFKISTNQSNFKFKIIWSAFDEKNEYDKLRPGNYAYYRNNQLIVCDSAGTTLKTFGEPNSQTSGDKLHLDNNGNIVLYGRLGAKPLTLVNATGVVVNPAWITERHVLGRLDTLTTAEDDRIWRTSWDDQQLFMSENGKFKLEMTENGNLVIKMSVLGCTGTSSDGTKYTTAKDNVSGKNYYLYEAEADMKMDKTFFAYAKDNVRELKRINVSGVNMKKGKSYTKYDNYAPSNTDNTVTVDNVAACEKKCTDDNNCDYYYSYATDDGKNNCKTGTNNDGSKTFIPIQPNSGIKSSQLYIRTKDMNLPSNDVRNNISMKTTSDYANYAAYTVSPALYEIGSSEIVQKIQTAADRQDKIMNGTNKLGKPETFTGMEGFNDHGYKTSEVLNAKYATQPTPIGLANAIQTQQITPLAKMAGDYNSLMANINSEYNTIGTNVSTATSLRDDLKNDKKSGYLDNNYEMMPHAKRVEDVRIDDINEMISQTNTAYTLGTITAMTLIIAGIFVMRN